MRAVPDRPRWNVRFARGLGLDRNPLRRASDRAEAWIRAGLLVIFLVAGPMAAVAAGQWAAHAAGAKAPQQGDAPGAAALAAVGALAVTALALLIALRLIKRLLDRRRLAAWEAAWRAIGPRWTGHKS